MLRLVFGGTVSTVKVSCVQGGCGMIKYAVLLLVLVGGVAASCGDWTVTSDGSACYTMKGNALLIRANGSNVTRTIRDPFVECGQNEVVHTTIAGSCAWRYGDGVFVRFVDDPAREWVYLGFNFTPITTYDEYVVREARWGGRLVLRDGVLRHEDYNEFSSWRPNARVRKVFYLNDITPQ